MPHIKIILGSVRPTRFGMQPAQWLLEIGKKVEGATFELVDLGDVNLPFLDESVSAKFAQTYEHDHTKQWSDIVGAADGFVFITAEYNHGYAPVLKNAIDYLYREWLHKPVAFMSYGAAAGGARAVEQLRQVVGQLNMYDISEHMMLPDYYLHQDDKGAYEFIDRHQRAAIAMLTHLSFWAETMKAARPNLPTVVQE